MRFRSKNSDKAIKDQRREKGCSDAIVPPSVSFILPTCFIPLSFCFCSLFSYIYIYAPTASMKVKNHRLQWVHLQATPPRSRTVKPCARLHLRCLLSAGAFEEDIMAILKRASIVLFANQKVFLRPPSEKHIPVQVIAYPHGEKDLLTQQCKDWKLHLGERIVIFSMLKRNLVCTALVSIY